MPRYEVRITETFIIEADHPLEAEEEALHGMEYPCFSDTQVEELEDEE